MKVIDVHCHLDQYDKKQLKDILSKNKVDVIVGAAMNKASGEKLLSIKRKYESIQVCLGIHPEYPEHYNEFEEVKKQILNNQHQIIAIGEIGLPYYSLEKMEKEQQAIMLEQGRVLLLKFLDLAERLDLPVVLHAIEETTAYVYEALQKRKITRALFHWLETDLDILKKIINSEYAISISPDVLYNNEYAEFVSHIPIENIVLESDGPWVYDDKTGIPNMILEVADYLSKKRNIEKQNILNQIYKNTYKLFKKNKINIK